MSSEEKLYQKLEYSKLLQLVLKNKVKDKKLALKYLQEKKRKNGDVKNVETKVENKTKKIKRKKLTSQDLQKAVKEIGEQEDKRRKEHKKESRVIIENSKLSREIKLILNRQLDEIEDEIKNKYEQIFRQEVSKLKEKGILYKVEYKEMKVEELASFGMKRLTKENWRFCFEHEGKLFFERIIGG